MKTWPREDVIQKLFSVRHVNPWEFGGDQEHLEDKTDPLKQRMTLYWQQTFTKKRVSVVTIMGCGLDWDVIAVRPDFQRTRRAGKRRRNNDEACKNIFPAVEPSSAWHLKSTWTSSTPFESVSDDEGSGSEKMLPHPFGHNRSVRPCWTDFLYPRDPEPFNYCRKEKNTIWFVAMISDKVVCTTP